MKTETQQSAKTEHLPRRHGGTEKIANFEKQNHLPQRTQRTIGQQSAKTRRVHRRGRKGRKGRSGDLVIARDRKGKTSAAEAEFILSA
jgi:hypothetical protein